LPRHAGLLRNHKEKTQNLVAQNALLLDRTSTYVPPTWQNGSRCRFASSQAHLSSWPNPHSTRGTAAAHIPRFRALALFGRRPLERVDNPTIPASENLVWGDWCQGESGGGCWVILSRHQIAFAAWLPPCPGALSGQAPKPLAARRRRGAWRRTRSPSHHNCRRDVQRIIRRCSRHRGLLLWGFSFHRHESSCSLKIGTTWSEGSSPSGRRKSRHSLVFGRSVCGSQPWCNHTHRRRSSGAAGPFCTAAFEAMVLRRGTATSDSSADPRAAKPFVLSLLSFDAVLMTPDVTRRPAEPRPS